MEERVRERSVMGLVERESWGERLEGLLVSMSERSEAGERLAFVGMRVEEEAMGAERGGRGRCEILRRGWACGGLLGAWRERDRSESTKRRESENILGISNQLGVVGRE